MVEKQSNQRCFTIKSVVDVVRARRSGLGIALEMGSELGRNIERYVGEGTITVTMHDRYIEIVAEDHGPGIPDVDRALAGGYTTSQGMGLGISGSRRLMDEFEIQSAVGRGTRIRAIKWLR